jgi:ferritin-like metal-binding protein YciE
MTTTLTDTKSGEMLIDWLRDAHAMEKQAEQMLTNTARRLENYPELKARMERHLDQTRRQADLVRGCIERLGGDTSMIKDMTGQIAGLGQALSGLFVDDEVVKGSMASYVFEQMEIASYRTLMAAAEHCGDLETKRVCETILREEEEMADWLRNQLPDITVKFLSLAERGETAKH